MIAVNERLDFRAQRYRPEADIYAGHQAALGSPVARRSSKRCSGASMPRSRAAAAIRRYSRGGSLSNFRQLLTALMPTSAISATAAVPPSASMRSLAVTMATSIFNAVEDSQGG